MDKNYIYNKLLPLSDYKYKNFISTLLPTVEKEQIIGVRMPELRKFAKELIKTQKDFADEFISALPHQYYEENILHMLIISSYKDLDKTIVELDKFLPYVDNWAVCDSQVPQMFRKYPDEVFEQIKLWMSSNKTYTIRYGILILMNIFLDKNFSKEHLYNVANIKSNEYYVNMMRAWYFQTALVKQYDDAIEVIEGKYMDTWTHNKAIQKAVESKKISSETKEYLRTLRIK